MTAAGDDLRFVTLDRLPEDRRDAVWEFDAWPEFMRHDPVGNRLYAPMTQHNLHLTGLLFDGDQPIAKCHALGFAWSGELDDLPDRGWDRIIERGVADAEAGREPTAASAIEVAIVPERRGRGLARRMLEGMREAVAAAGLTDLFAPVRPSRKSDDPHEPMRDYIARTRNDGLSIDPWLRAHQRQGAGIVRVCPTSMVIPGTLEEWRSWTGLPFDTSGPTVVPDALVPVHVDVEQDHAVYVEPNVWMHHRLG